MWRESREHSFAKLEDKIQLFSRVFEFASAEKTNSDPSGESMRANVVPEPPTMLLFAFAIIGMASIGRKKFLKK